MALAFHSCVVTGEDELLWWGYNKSGQLGNGTTDNSCRPIPLKAFGGRTPVQAALGNQFSMVLDQEGRIWTFGSNSEGQLGTGTTANHSTPTPVHSLQGVAKISCGVNHSMALLRDGALYSWGGNRYGQLGVGDTSQQRLPARVPWSGPRITHIDCGGFFTVALTEAGWLYAWGCNHCGQLGLGHKENQAAPQRLEGLRDVLEVSCGGRHVLAITKGGELYRWGNSQSGVSSEIPTRITTLPSRPLQISCGGTHSMVLLSDNSLYCWGRNNYGQLGNGTTKAAAEPTQLQGISERIMQIKCGGV